MKGVFNHLNNWLHRKESEKFTTDGDGNTAVRSQGEISLAIEVDSGLTQNIAAPLANTEYSFTIPLGTKRFEWKSRKFGEIQWSFQIGESGTTFSTLSPGNLKTEDNLKLVVPIVVYFRSNKANDTIELSSWS